MRAFEVLAAALFTLDTTGSGSAVALVTAARMMPMFLLGAFSGVVTEAVNRKQVLVAGQLLTGLASATVAALAWAGVVRPWHVGVTVLVAGTVWQTEMATARRMVGECVEGGLVPRAPALDTMSNSFTRLLGPVFAGAVQQRLGLAGSFGLSVCIGTGLLGNLLMGTIANSVGPWLAIDLVTTAGFISVCLLAAA